MIDLPAKNAKPTGANIRALENGLTSVIAYHANAGVPWTFYEVIDEYLGPWLDTGYPITYGKYYCIAFNTNEKLQDNGQTRDWVHRATIALQEPLRDFIVEKFRAGKLASLSEYEVRQFAFSVHPRAYTQGGLTMVLLIAPEMLPVIATIPAAEFSPHSQNFAATWKQVFTTAGMVLPEAAGMSLAALAGPAHTGILGRAMRMDADNFMRDQQMAAWLSRTSRIVQSGRMDNITLLTQLTDRLNIIEYSDQGMASIAGKLERLANEHKRSVAAYYRKQIAEKPSLQKSITEWDPEWVNWLNR